MDVSGDVRGHLPALADVRPAAEGCRPEAIMLHFLAFVVLAWLFWEGLGEILGLVITNAYWLIPAAIVGVLLLWWSGASDAEKPEDNGSLPPSHQPEKIPDASGSIKAPDYTSPSDSDLSSPDKPCPWDPPRLFQLFYPLQERQDEQYKSYKVKYRAWARGADPGGRFMPRARELCEEAVASALSEVNEQVDQSRDGGNTELSARLVSQAEERAAAEVDTRIRAESMPDAIRAQLSIDAKGAVKEGYPHGLHSTRPVTASQSSVVQGSPHSDKDTALEKRNTPGATTGMVASAKDDEFQKGLKTAIDQLAGEHADAQGYYNDVSDAKRSLVAASLARALQRKPYDFVAKALQDKLGVTLDLGDGVKLELAIISDGAFTMGCPPKEAARHPDETQHQVTISRPYFMGKQPVSVAQYRQFIAKSGYKYHTDPNFGSSWNKPEPGRRQTDDSPVRCVSWEDAQAFARWATGQVGRTVRLPSEAEWERACGLEAAEDDRQWSSGNSPEPNAWGLYAMFGQGSHWCQDWYGEYPTDAVTDPSGPTAGSFRILRGNPGMNALCIRWSVRARRVTSSCGSDVIFRVVVQ